MSDTLFELRGNVLHEARARCGCRFVLVYRQMLDAREGHWYTGTALVVIPCDPSHYALAMEVAEPFAGEAAVESTVVEAAVAMTAKLA